MKYLLSSSLVAHFSWLVSSSVIKIFFWHDVESEVLFFCYSIYKAVHKSRGSINEVNQIAQVCSDICFEIT